MKSPFLPKYEEKIVRISALTTQGNPCNHYREWVCSVISSPKQYLRKAMQHSVIMGVFTFSLSRFRFLAIALNKLQPLCMRFYFQTSIEVRRNSRSIKFLTSNICSKQKIINGKFVTSYFFIKNESHN